VNGSNLTKVIGAVAFAAVAVQLPPSTARGGWVDEGVRFLWRSAAPVADDVLVHLAVRHKKRTPSSTQPPRAVLGGSWTATAAKATAPITFVRFEPFTRNLRLKCSLRRLCEKVADCGKLVAQFGLRASSFGGMQWPEPALVSGCGHRCRRALLARERGLFGIHCPGNET